MADLYSGYNGTKQNPKAPTAPSSGTDYSAVQNPYSISYANRTGWDAFVESLGFTSAYQKYEMERKRNEELWNSSQQEMQRQEMYNSASEQVAREREAGLNPDLNGGVTAGDASEQTPLPIGSESEAIQNMNQGFSTVASLVMQGVNWIADITSSCVSGALAISSKLESLRGIKVENLNKVSAGVANMVDELDSLGFNPIEFDKDGEGNIVLPDAIKEDFNSYIDSLPWKYRKFAKKYQSRYIQSLVHWNKRGDKLGKLPDSIVANEAVKGFVGDATYNPISKTFKNLDPLLNDAINAQNEMYKLLYNMNLKEFQNKDGALDIEKLNNYSDKVTSEVTATKKSFDKAVLDTVNQMTTSDDWKTRVLGIAIKAAWVVGDKFNSRLERNLGTATNVIKSVK